MAVEHTEEMAMTSWAVALIAAKPGPMRDGLHVLMTAIAGVDKVIKVGDAASALRVALEHRPALVLLDASLLEDHHWEVLGKTIAEGPPSRCIVLADDIQQQEKARVARVHAVVLKGFPASKLVEAIERLLSGQEERPRPFT